MQRLLKCLPVLFLVAFVAAQISLNCSEAAPSSPSNTCSSLQPDEHNLVSDSPTGLAAPTGIKEGLALICGVSIQYAFGGGILINIATSRPVPYRVEKVDSSGKLIVDFAGARDAWPHQEDVIQSALVDRVRIDQLSSSNPATVRVTSDLKGSPAYSVNTLSSGVRIEVRPHASPGSTAVQASKPAEQPVKVSTSRKAELQSSVWSGEAVSLAGKPAKRQDKDSATNKMKAASQKDETSRPAIRVHKFADLSAGLRRPKLEFHPKSSMTGEKSLPASVIPDAPAQVYGISIKPNTGGETSIDISSTRAIPYRVFQLSDPYRLVVDMKNARNTNPRPVYPVDSEVLRRVRVAQWQDGTPTVPAVVRVVADLEGIPIFDVHAQQPGIRIDLRPREVIRSLLRNPFAYTPPPQLPKTAASPAPTAEAMTTAGTPPGVQAQASASFASDLKVMGYVQQPGLGMEAIISDTYQIYFVPEGGTFGGHFRLISMTSNAVEIQDSSSSQTAWLSLAPQ